MMNKKGWLRIMEATIAILIVSSVLVIVYSKQIKPIDQNEQIFNLQKRILRDIALRSDLRLKVLSGQEQSWVEVRTFASNNVPLSYGSYLAICELGDPCNLPSQDAADNFREDVDVFVEEAVISAEVGDVKQLYDPKKIRLFVWEAIEA